MNGDRVLEMMDRQSLGSMAVIIRHADRNDIASVTESLGGRVERQRKDGG